MPSDDRGLRLTTNSAEAALAYNAAVGDYLEYRLSAMDNVKKALAADPEFAMAYCLRGYFLLLIGTTATVPGANKALARAERLADRLTARERRHIAALEAWCRGDVTGAADAWERILIDEPRDLLALRLHHFNAFWRGRADLLRDVPAGVLHAWSRGLPGYGNVLGMLAFGLEESGDCARAERLGREAVDLEPDDLWSVHAVAHVLETEERYEDGLAWLAQPRSIWDDRNPFKDHIWWHRALYALELGDDAEVLDLYDDQIRVDESGFYLDVQNAASLLFRLQLLGIDVGDRWQPLGAVAEQKLDDHVLPFTDAHVVLALAAAGRLEAAERYIRTLPSYGEMKEGERAAEVLRQVGAATIAYVRGEHQGGLEHIWPVRHELAVIGGSHAQRDVFAQLAIELALRAGDANRARALLSERATLRPRSRFLQAAAERMAGHADAARPV